MMHRGPERELVLRGTKALLRDKRPEDAWDEWVWRSDAELAELDAAFPLTLPFDSFRAFFLEDLSSSSRDSYRFAVDTLDGVHIGNCMYYDLNPSKSEAELGILIGNKDYWSNGYGTEAIRLLLDYMFRDLGLKRVYLKTLDWNIRAQKSFKKSGFVEYGKSSRSLWNFILMDITREQWMGLDPSHVPAQDYPRSVFP